MLLIRIPWDLFPVVTNKHVYHASFGLVYIVRTRMHVSVKIIALD